MRGDYTPDDELELARSTLVSITTELNAGLHNVQLGNEYVTLSTDQVRYLMWLKTA